MASEAKKAETLKDRIAYRETLKQRQADLDAKVARVEEEIKALRGK